LTICLVDMLAQTRHA